MYILFNSRFTSYNEQVSKLNFLALVTVQLPPSVCEAFRCSSFHNTDTPIYVFTNLSIYLFLTNKKLLSGMTVTDYGTGINRVTNTYQVSLMSVTGRNIGTMFCYLHEYSAYATSQPVPKFPCIIVPNR